MLEKRRADLLEYVGKWFDECLERANTIPNHYSLDRSVGKLVIELDELRNRPEEQEVLSITVEPTMPLERL